MLPDTLPLKQENEMSLICGNYKIQAIDDGKLTRTMDTGSDHFSCLIPWEPGRDPELDRVTGPYQYSECGIYLGGELQMKGILYITKPSLSQKGRTRSLEIFSKTADIIDSTVIAPYEANNISLVDRCKQQCTQFDINVLTDIDVINSLTITRRITTTVGMSTQMTTAARLSGINMFAFEGVIIPLYRPRTLTRFVKETKKFSRVQAEQTDTIFTHLQKLAAQWGLLLSCTRDGDLLITKAKIDSINVGTIEEGGPYFDSIDAEFNGRNRYKYYRALAHSSRHNRSLLSAQIEDITVQKPRLLTFKAPESLPGEATNAAEWRKNKSAADAMTITLPVNFWRAPNGKLWEPNTLVTVVSPTIGCPNGFTFLITRVTHNIDTTAELQIKPPGAYTIGAMEEPWT